MKKRCLLLALAFALLFPVGSVFAKEYNDVFKDHWAWEYIHTLSEEKVLSGYPDGNYYPNRNVTFLEWLKLLSGLFQPTKQDMKLAIMTYEPWVYTKDIPSWARESLGIALDRKVITKDELENLRTKGLLTDTPKNVPDRQSIALYMARALGVEPKEATDILKYQDKEKISKDILPYLVPLVEKGIFSPTGSDGKFEGHRGIRRSEMAKIMVKARPFIKKYENPETPIANQDMFQDHFIYQDKNQYEPFIQNMKDYFWNEAKKSFEKNYELLGQKLEGKLYTEKGRPAFRGNYVLILKNYDRDPDTVKYIKEAKENKDPYYPIYKKEYLEPKDFVYTNIYVKQLENGKLEILEASQPHGKQWLPFKMN